MATDRRITYGLAAGSLVVAAYLVAYRMDPKFMLGSVLYWSSTGLVLLAMIAAVLRERELRGGLEFNAVLKIAFGVFIIANALYYIFYYCIFAYDPSLKLVAREIAFESLEQVKALVGNEPGNSQYREMEQQVRAQDHSVSLQVVLFSFAQGAIGGFVLSAILAFLLRSPTLKQR